MASVAIAPFKAGEARNKSYYSGDVISYKGTVVVATTNVGKLELFTLTDQATFHRFAAFSSYDQRFSKAVDFTDSLLNIEDGKLYVYAVDGKGLYKYDISNLRNATEVARAHDNSWDWFGGVEKIGGYVATIGTNNVKLWTSNLNVYDAYAIHTPGNYVFNTSSAGSDRYIFTIADQKIRIFDKQSRTSVTEIPLEFRWAGNSAKRGIYNDRVDQAVYVVDDEAVRKVNFAGEVEKSFDHTGSLGYDVVPSTSGEEIYFSDGIGVVKLRKDDFKVLNYEYTQGLGEGNGWAMGLKSVEYKGNEILVLFNGSGIFVLDSNLKPLTSSRGELTIATTTEPETVPAVIEPLSLRANTNYGTAGSSFVLHGTGFGQNEMLTVSFAGTTRLLMADEAGAFETTVQVPTVPAQRTDVRVKGNMTGLSYSLAFTIQ